MNLKTKASSIRLSINSAWKPVFKRLQNTFILRTKVNGEGFFNWLRGWGSKAKILSPASLVEQMKEEARKMMDLNS
ncbi:hypothetical protein BTR25_23645 [Bacillus sp. MRMR6]|nr:hypothetical protein BTR25_23645 [Bacillus sp. MRMR6]